MVVKFVQFPETNFWALILMYRELNPALYFFCLANVHASKVRVRVSDICLNVLVPVEVCLKF